MHVEEVQVQGVLHDILTPLPGKNHELVFERPPWPRLTAVCGEAVIFGYFEAFHVNTLAQEVCFSVMEYVPGGHNVHAVDPVAIVYVPIEHEVHVVVIGEEAYVPAEQEKQVVGPTVAEISTVYVPTEHEMQDVGPTISA